MAQGDAAADTLHRGDLAEGAYEVLEMLNVKDADLRDVFRGIAHAHDLNVVVDNRIDRRVTVRLSNLPVIDALRFLSRQAGLRLSRQGPILHIDLPPDPPPAPPDVTVTAGRLSLDLDGDDLETVIRHVAEQSGLNIIVRRGVRGTLAGQLQDVAVDAGLQTLLSANGYTMHEDDGIYHVDRAGLTDVGGAPLPGRFWVQVRDSLVTLDLVDAPIADVLREIGTRAGVNLVTYEVPDTTITARVDGLPLDASLDFLLKGTDVTYRRAQAVYFVGNKQTSGIASTRLIRLDHIRADNVLDLLPELITANATIQVVREHNGLMVTGTHDVLVELEAFVREIDFPTPQILVEALVVDFEATDLFSLGIRVGRGGEAGGGETIVAFDGDGREGAGLVLGGDGDDLRWTLDRFSGLSRLFGVRRIGYLPDDFYVRLQALQRDGKVNIRSRPQISTLNGHPASISIGTTQYYILETNTPYQTPNQFYLQATERFEKVEANVRLEIVPWVSASGEVTTEIRPEFSAPVGEFDPLVPPTINSRVLDSTVRLRDGETIILGGLIQDVTAVTRDRIPLLGSIPLLGRLFSGQRHERKKSELVIFLTPHVFYGDARDDARWRALRDGLDLSASRPRRLGHTEIKE